MIKLIKLEMRKFNFSGYLKGVLIANLSIVILVTLINYVERIDRGMIPFIDIMETLKIIGSLVRATFMIYAAVLIAQLIISEYRNKTINVLFTYPVNRVKLLATKLLFIALLTFLVIVVSNFFGAAAFLGINSIFHFMPTDMLTAEVRLQYGVMIVVQAAAAASMSLTALYFGMRKKSVSATIVSSIIITVVTVSENAGFSLSSIIAIPLTLGAIGILIAYLTIKDVEVKDVV